MYELHHGVKARLVSSPVLEPFAGDSWQGCGVPTRRGLIGAPRDYLARGGSWPAGPFKTDAPVAVRYAAAIAQALQAAIADAGMSRTQAANALQIARPTLYDVLGGRTFPDIHTIAKAEQAFGTRLWPQG